MASLRFPSLGLLALASSLSFPTAVYARPQHCPRDAPYTHKGCFVSNTNGQRIVNTATYADDAMTIASCATFCTEKNLKYFGVEYGRECYCGDSFPADPAVDTSECSFTCPGGGETGQTCGAGDRIDLYQNNLYAGRAPATLDIPYLGCFVDSGDRVLPDNLLGSDEMTAELCEAHCSDYFYFGVEYGRECWCGDIKPTNPAPEAECSLTCTGDVKQVCGAGGRLNAWARPWPVPSAVGEYEYNGCYTDRGDKHTLTGRVEYLSDMTHEKCAAFCDKYNYPFFGVEFGSQCLCGTKIEDMTEIRPIEECSTKCGGELSQRCGAANRLSIFEKPAGPDPVNLDRVGSYSYKSCWTDDVNERVLTGSEYRSDDMTVESCAAFCSQQNFEFFGVEYAHECYCGDKLGGAVAPEGECSQVCAGNSAQWCGGASRLNIYSLTRLPSRSSSIPPVSSPPGQASSSVPSSSSSVPSSSSSVPSSSPVPSISSSAPTPSSTIFSSSSISTTVSISTSPTTTAPYCDPTTTWSPERCWASLPPACAALGKTPVPNFVQASMSAGSCSGSLAQGTATGFQSCLTSYQIPNRFTASNAYACLTNLPNMYCTMTTTSCDPFATLTPAVPNGDFESGNLGPWTVQMGDAYPNLAVSVSDEKPHTGRYSFKFDYKGNGGVWMYLRHADVKLQPGATYELSYWNWASNTDAYLDPSVMMMAGGARFGFNSYRPAKRANEWYRQAVTFVAPTSYARLDLQFLVVVGAVPALSYVDDIAIVKVI
ncbi:WSC domain containing protein [Rhypophila decipiens]